MFASLCPGQVCIERQRWHSCTGTQLHRTGSLLLWSERWHPSQIHLPTCPSGWWSQQAEPLGGHGWRLVNSISALGRGGLRELVPPLHMRAQQEGVLCEEWASPDPPPAGASILGFPALRPTGKKLLCTGHPVSVRARSRPSGQRRLSTHTDIRGREKQRLRSQPAPLCGVAVTCPHGEGSSPHLLLGWGPTELLFLVAALTMTRSQPPCLPRSSLLFPKLCSSGKQKSSEGNIWGAGNCCFLCLSSF